MNATPEDIQHVALAAGRVSAEAAREALQHTLCTAYITGETMANVSLHSISAHHLEHYIKDVLERAGFDLSQPWQIEPDMRGGCRYYQLRHDAAIQAPRP